MSLGNFYSQTVKTVTTRNISGMLLWCKEKSTNIRPEETKPYARTLISLWFCGLHACPDLRLSKKSFVGFHMAWDEGLFILDWRQFYRPKNRSVCLDQSE